MSPPTSWKNKQQKIQQSLSFASFCAVLLSSHDQFCSIASRTGVKVVPAGHAEVKGTTWSRKQEQASGSSKLDTKGPAQVKPTKRPAKSKKFKFRQVETQKQGDVGDGSSSPITVKGNGRQIRSGRKLQTDEIFIYNLPAETKTTWVQNVFGVFGEIVLASVPHRPNRKGKFFGFVKFRSSEAANQEIVSLNGLKINGNSLLVHLARHRKVKNQSTGKSVTNRSNTTVDAGTDAEVAMEVDHQPPSEPDALRDRGEREETPANPDISNPEQVFRDFEISTHETSAEIHGDEIALIDGEGVLFAPDTQASISQKKFSASTPKSTQDRSEIAGSVLRLDGRGRSTACPILGHGLQGQVQLLVGNGSQAQDQVSIGDTVDSSLDQEIQDKNNQFRIGSSPNRAGSVEHGDPSEDQSSPWKEALLKPKRQTRPPKFLEDFELHKRGRRLKGTAKSPTIVIHQGKSRDRSSSRDRELRNAEWSKLNLAAKQSIIQGTLHSEVTDARESFDDGTS